MVRSSNPDLTHYGQLVSFCPFWPSKKCKEFSLFLTFSQKTKHPEMTTASLHVEVCACLFPFIGNCTLYGNHRFETQEEP